MRHETLIANNIEASNRIRSAYETIYRAGDFTMRLARDVGTYELSPTALDLEIPVMKRRLRQMLADLEAVEAQGGVLADIYLEAAE